MLGGGHISPVLAFIHLCSFQQLKWGGRSEALDRGKPRFTLLREAEL